VFYPEHPSGILRNRQIRITDPAWRFHLRRFYLAIDAYRDSNKPKLTTSELLWGASEGPKYAKRLKKIKLLSYLYSQKMRVLHFPEDYKDIPVSFITDIGDIFNFAYLFHWEEECEDWKDGMIPLPRILQSDLDHLEEVVYSLLPDGVARVNPQEILLEVSASSSTTTDTFLASAQWKERGKSAGMKFANTPLIGRRTLVQVGPGNVRDTVVIPLNQVNSIRFIDAQIWEVLSQMPGHAMIKDPERQKQVLDDFESKFYYFYCRDLQKEGITKPRIIILTIIKALRRKYPDFEAFQYGGIYEGYTVLENSKRYDMIRGHGLGMANALTTLMNIAMFHLTIDEIWRHDSVFDKVDSLSYNDDFVAGFRSENDLESYYSYEDDVLNRFGLIRKPEKSFIGHKTFVFLETYYPSHLNRKDSYYRREVLNSLACTNVVQAKELINSLSAQVKPEILREYLTEIISYWPYEFFPGEERLPFSLGGWISYRFRNVSLDLKVYFDDERNVFDARVIRAYKAQMSSAYLTRRGNRTKFRSPLEYLIPLASTVDDRKFKDRFFLDCTFADMQATHERLKSSPSLNKLYWDRVRLKRLQVFGQYPNIFDPFQAYEEIIKTYPYDFIAPISLPHDKFYVIESEIIRPLDPYKVNVNPLMAGISAYTGINFPGVYPSKFEGLGVRRAKFHRLKGDRHTDVIIDSVRLRPNGDFFTFSDNLTPVLPLCGSDNETEFLESFNDPTDAWMASRSLGLSYIPFRKEHKIELLEEKKEMYGRLLTLHEIYVINILNIKSGYAIKVMTELNYFDEACHDLLEEYTEPPEEVPVDSNKEQWWLFMDEEPLNAEEEILFFPKKEEEEDLSEIPDIFSIKNYRGPENYYQAWLDLCQEVTNAGLRSAIHDLSGSHHLAPKPLSAAARAIVKAQGAREIVIDGLYYLDLESPEEDSGGGEEDGFACLEGW
jgi:hypothetical protein